MCWHIDGEIRVHTSQRVDTSRQLRKEMTVNMYSKWLLEGACKSCEGLGKPTVCLQ